MIYNSKLKIQINEILLTFVLLPFFSPYGFYSYFRGYKLFFTLWLYGSVLLIGLIFLCYFSGKKIKNNWCIITLLIYYMYFIFDTIILQNGITEGYQKLLVAPILCLFCILVLMKKPIRFINCVANLLLCNLILNITLFSPLLWGDFFQPDGNHVMFVGHVQVVSQMGILSLLVSLCLWEIGKKRKAKFLIFFSLINMIVSKTAASYIVILITFFMIGIYPIRSYVNRISTNMIICGYISLNLILTIILKANGFNTIKNILNQLTNSRVVIWKELLAMMQNHWLFGYGAYGALIKVYWSKGGGMNYAHNEFFQRLLDGGIISLFFFICLLFMYSRKIKLITNKRMAYWTRVYLVCFLIVMIFESVTEYYFFYIFMTILYYLPLITNREVKTYEVFSRN